MTRSCESFGLLFSILVSASLLACGGEIETDDAAVSPPAVNTRLALRIDGKAISLEAPSGTRFVQTAGGLPTYVAISARQDPGGGDHIRSVDLQLNEPFTTGTFDCTPNERGEVVGKQAALSPGDFFGFKATLTDCLVTVNYIANDRVVGTFSVRARAPEGSSPSGTVSKAEGEFDVPIKDMKL